MFLSTAYAQASTPGQPALWESLMPMVLIFAVFYFFIIRPQGKRLKAHREMMDSLKRGDEVITSGGIIGSIEGLTDKVVTLQIADEVKIKVLKSQISGLAKESLK